MHFLTIQKYNHQSKKYIKEAIKVSLWKISSVVTCLLKQEIGQFPWRLAWYTILVGWCRPLFSVTEKAFSLSTCFHFSISELMEELELSLFTLKMMYFYKNFKPFYVKTRVHHDHVSSKFDDEDDEDDGWWWWRIMMISSSSYFDYYTCILIITWNK